MKLLKSNYYKRGYWENTTQFEKKYHGKKYPIEQHDVNELWASVPKAESHLGKEFYGPVKDDIAKNGLYNPLLIVKCTKAELKGQKAKYGHLINELPFWMADDKEDEKLLVVWGGSNRLYAARELGYTHVDCAIVPTFQEAMALQKCHRHTHQQYYPKDYWR